MKSEEVATYAGEEATAMSPESTAYVRFVTELAARGVAVAEALNVLFAAS